MTETTSALGTTADSPTGGGTTVCVIMENHSLNPAEVTIKIGDTAEWVNADPVNHDVIAKDDTFESELFGKDETFSFHFTEAGTFPYYCSIHPGMAGTVIVQ